MIIRDDMLLVLIGFTFLLISVNTKYCIKILNLFM